MAVKTLFSFGEAAFTDKLAKQMQARLGPMRTGWQLSLGIGDDTAVLKTPKKESLLFASDMLVEGVHFSSKLDPQWIGWKALASNLSDIAAMGGTPIACVVSLGVKRSTPLKKVEAIYRGLKRCAQKYRVGIVGGDTVRSECLTIDVAILGQVKHSQVTLRSGACVGDRLFVTGSLGRSYQRGTHARFEPRLEQSQKLVQLVKVHAMMDLSDGLADGLWRIAKASGVGLSIDQDRVPLARGANFKQALSDGEDFELLFAVSARDAEKLPHMIAKCPLREIGEVVSSRTGVSWVDARGKSHKLKDTGFQHF